MLKIIKKTFWYFSSQKFSAVDNQSLTSWWCHSNKPANEGQHSKFISHCWHWLIMWSTLTRVHALLFSSRVVNSWNKLSEGMFTADCWHFQTVAGCWVVFQWVENRLGSYWSWSLNNTKQFINHSTSGAKIAPSYNLRQCLLPKSHISRIFPV